MGRAAKSLAVSAVIVIAILLSAITHIGTQTLASSGQLRIVATFFPLYDWAKNVVGDKGSVTNLTPAGIDPHDLDPTPQDISMILNSHVFLYNGIGFEPWVEKVLPMIDRAKTVVVDVSLGVDIMHDRFGRGDPHFWLDPLLVINAVENIELGIQQADPVNAAYYSTNVQTYIGRLRAVHLAFLSNMTSVRARFFITFHEAFGYWKRRYNLTEIGIYGADPEGEPSAAHMQDLIRLAREQHITMVLASNLDDPRWCQVLADQLKGKVRILDPLEGPTAGQMQTGNYTYIGRLYYNIEILKETLA